MKITAENFIKFQDITKEKIINMACRFATHNFITKDALVEIVKYQNEKIKEMENENMSFRILQADVLRWAKDKKLLDIRYFNKQFMKFIEEVFEFKREWDIGDFRFGLGDDEDDIWKDTKLEMGDVFVTLIILCEQIGIDPEECLKMAYDKIKDRTGRTINGQFIKEEDLEE